MSERIGFMQGRLSPVVDGRIQAFPRDHWREEFALAQQHGFRLMEWTLDQDGLHDNPFLTAAGQREIASLCARHDIAIPSVTGDCFMQAPFWKAQGTGREALLRDLLAVIDACPRAGVGLIVVPFVDGGRLDTPAQEDDALAGFDTVAAVLARRGVRVAFESDFAPPELARLIGRYDPALFGVNYDIGNSAALGYDAGEELAAYGARVIGVHVKDRLRGGTTVPLGTGAAAFDAVFAALARAGYVGPYILQTARAGNDDHVGVLLRYRDLTADWLARHPLPPHAA